MGLSFRTVYGTVLDFLFPKQCLHCTKYGNFICNYCTKHFVRFETELLCHVCHTPLLRTQLETSHARCREFTQLRRVSTSVRFTGITKNLLHELKYNYYFGLAEDVATLMIKTMDLSMLTDTTLVPIPLHWYKKNKRGFNQAELIAKHLVRLSKKSTRVIPLLTRVRNTKTQVGMKKEDRQQNLTNAFKVNPKLLKTIETDTVTLVDDVFTTGTTLEQCAQVLKEHGIKHVDAIVFARG